MIIRTPFFSKFIHNENLVMTFNQNDIQVFKSKLTGGCCMARLDYWVKSGEEYQAKIRIRDLSAMKKPYCLVNR